VFQTDASFEAHHEKLNEDTHTTSDEDVALDFSFWQYNVYVDIRRGSLESGRQTTLRQSKTSIFSVFGRYVFGTLGNEANIII